MARPTLDREKAARILALADQAGDVEAAKHFGVSTKSISRYRARVLTDPELSRLVAEKKREFEAASSGWAEDAAGFMSRAIRKLDTLVAQAPALPGSIREVAGAIKIVGELDITRKVLSDGEQPGADSEGAEPPAASGQPAAPTLN